MRPVLFIIAFLGSISLVSQEWSVDKIEPKLLKGANAIIRTYDQYFEVNDESNALYREKKVVTVFNDKGFKHAIFQEAYDPLMSIRRIELSYYNASGERLKKVKMGQIMDVNVTSAGSLYDDLRIKRYYPENYDYPFTMVQEYEYDFQKLFGIIPFQPEIYESVAVENASYRLVYPESQPVNYALMNAVSEPEIERAEKITLKWQLKERPARKVEYRGESILKSSPHVLFAPVNFMMEGYAGKLEDWSGLGEWLNMLKEGRDILTDEIKREIDELVAGVSSKREKTKLIYEYMQKNTRYVSIQLGIGGLQPFPATDVIENGYGDCKALTNYTYSLLKHAGIRSDYAVIRAGANEDEINADFPSSQFNHVILAVPMERDTVWLECTSQTAPFNYLGDFTDDRYALLVNERGGQLVRTPKFEAEDSEQLSNIDIALDQNGDAEVSAEIRYTGKQYALHYWKAQRGKKDMEEYLLKTIDLPSFQLKSFEYVDNRTEESPELIGRINMKINKFTTESGGRMFLAPNLLNKPRYNPPKDSNRESPIIHTFGYHDVDSVRIKLPENYRLEFEIEDQLFDSEFGEYSLSYNYEHENHELTFVREILIKEGRYEPEKYKEYRSFMRRISKYDRSQIVLSKGT